MTGICMRENIEEVEAENLSDYATKSKSLYGNRFIDEEEDIYQTSFQMDIERILYSNPFRRLRTKTQVFTDPNDQHNRTRLTHSLEVAYLSRRVARALRLNTDLTEAAALGHDLGHTPYGHAGERALNDMLKEKGGFSHNSQSVWVVENCYHGHKIMGKNILGLNLTYGVREGIWKHTKLTTNLTEYKWLKPDKAATLEGQVVKLCDSLAYLRHDIEDAVRNHLIEEAQLIELWEKETEYPYSLWFQTLINDMIVNSADKEIIGYSESIKKVYDVMRQWVQEKIISSPKIKSLDAIGYEIVCEMYDLLIKNPELLPKNTENERKLRWNGLERVVVDLIQWLGDQNFESVLEGYKRRIKGV